MKSAVSCYLFHSQDQEFTLILVVPLFEIHMPLYYENIFKEMCLKYLKVSTLTLENFQIYISCH